MAGTGFKAVTLTEGRKHDVTVGRILQFPKGNIVVMDKAYKDYSWYKQWIAPRMYLLLAFLKFQSKLTKSMHQILRLLQPNLFEKRDMMALLRGDPPPDTLADPNQMVML